MELPFEILDLIFFFLRSHPKSLVACSKAHPAFSQAIEPHLYSHVRFPSSRDSWWIGNGYILQPSNLIKLLSKTPRIINYIRVLEIDFIDLNRRRIAEATWDRIEDASLILSMLSESRLECVILMNECHGRTISWKQLPQRLKTALENCLRLPTLRRVHVGELDFPLSLLDGHVNINCLSLSGTPQIPDCSDDANPNPQLTALSLDHYHNLTSFITWAKRHIVKLQSLKCDYSNEEMISELLGICSDTLNTLDFQLMAPYEAVIFDSTEEPRHNSMPSVDLSSLPHLQHLIIRGVVHHSSNPNDPDDYCYISQLPAIVEIIKNAPLMQHLTIDIHVYEDVTKSLSDLNFPLFAALAKSSASFQHIDLYIRGLTPELVVPLLGEFGGVTELVEQGVLVIHMDETAPGDSRFL